MATLYINRSDSKCSDCGKGCDPRETHHFTILSWSGSSDGCGAEYTNMSSDYFWPGVHSSGIEKACMLMRPDLDFVCGGDVMFKAPHAPYQDKLFNDTGRVNYDNHINYGVTDAR